MDHIHIYGGNNEHWKRTNGDEIFLDNFLTKDDDRGIRFVMNESFIIFGVGRRDCVGRQLAMKEIRYTLAYLLMNYNVSLYDEQDKNHEIKERAVIDPPIRICFMDLCHTYLALYIFFKWQQLLIQQLLIQRDAFP